MLDFLKYLKKEPFDFLTFLEGDEEGQITIIGQEYANKGLPVGGSTLGESYHIVLFRDSKENKDEYGDLDSFEAILSDPLEYISGLIPSGFYGIIAKRTTTSEKIINKLLDNMKESM
jgi:hypothetical protein